MATPGPEVELLAGGVETRSLDRGNWSQNVWSPSNEQGLQVRKGFGQIAQIDSTLADYSGDGFRNDSDLVCVFDQSEYGRRGVLYR